MAFYKLSKGHLSKIRFDKAGVDALLERGFTLIGEVNSNGVLVDENPEIEDTEDPELESLKAYALEIGMPKVSVARFRSVESLKAKIEEFEQEEEEDPDEAA